ncbi:MAG: hypothetical protein LBK98_00875 [Peptococcaceae bacterium]|jgi:riboflavin kinase/FMN adenylyltransferase|nr:hypothetical protein [Peptococcaceae bacterium]
MDLLISADKKEIAAFAAANKLYVALGYFDGVHRGHQALLDMTREGAAAAGGQPCVLLLEPHPAKVLRGNEALRNLTTLNEKIALIRRQGPFQIFLQRFDAAFAGILPRDFVRIYLVELLRARGVFCGFNYTFGRQGQGQWADLAYWGGVYGFEARKVPPVYQGTRLISSTAIRQLIEVGETEAARRMLGHPQVYSGYGDGAAGDGWGRETGLTAMSVALAPDMIWPADGVYGGLAWIGEGPSRRALVKVDRRPGGGREAQTPAFEGERASSFFEGERASSFEVGLSGYDGDLNGKKISVILTDPLTDPTRAPGALPALAAEREVTVWDKEAAERAAAALAAALGRDGQPPAEWFV